MEDSTRKFDGRAEDYTLGRPSYSEELIGFLYEKFGLSGKSVIADIGSGTGKFAAHLLERGSEVFCVEPNRDMRLAAESELGRYPNFHSVNGDAENTGLADHCTDFITSAQAFHWFDAAKFRSECLRMIKNGGSAALIWNMRNMADPVNNELFEIYTDCCPRFKGFGGGIMKDDPRISEFFGGEYGYAEFDYPLYYGRERFISRSLSGSYSLKDGDAGYEKYFEKIVSVFEKYAMDGIVRIENKSAAYFGRLIIDQPSAP